MNNEVVVSNSATDFFPEQHCVPAAADPSAIKWKITLTLNNIRNENQSE
jgi:hypothetical protein